VALTVLLLQLLDRNPTTRLGMSTSPHGAIRQHPFFNELDWQKLETRQINPPFQPRVVSTQLTLFHTYNMKFDQISFL